MPSCGPAPIVLPPPVGGAGGGVNGVGSVGYVLGQPPASSYGAHHGPPEGGMRFRSLGTERTKARITAIRLRKNRDHHPFSL